MDTFGLPLILLIFSASLYALMKGADYLIDGSSGIAKRLGVSQLLIGLTVIAVGTSLPELVVSIKAAIQGKGSLALANVIGSNSTNILLVIGATAMIAPLSAPSSLRRSEIPFSFLLMLAFLGMVISSGHLEMTTGLFHESNSVLQQWGGFLLLGFFAAFIIKLVLGNQISDEVDHDHEEPVNPWLKVIGGTALILIGGKYTVDGAIAIARVLGVSETTIGLTIVAFGTSLPELVASVTAAKKGYSDMAIGNVIGSNIMNLALVLGTAGAIKSIPIGSFELMDIAFMSLVTFLFLAVIMRQRKPQINRLTGGAFVAIYTVYVTYVALR